MKCVCNYLGSETEMTDTMATMILLNVDMTSKWNAVKCESETVKYIYYSIMWKLGVVIININGVAAWLQPVNAGMAYRLGGS
jgi:hypothetical protein